MTIFSTNLFAANAVSGWNDIDGMYDMMDGYGMFGWGFMLFFWPLMILGIVYLVRLISERNEFKKAERSALDILKERYAKGEIDKEEFDAKKKDLM